MQLATSCQLLHIVDTVRQMEIKEALKRLMQHIQTVSKTHFYDNILTSKIFGKPSSLYPVYNIDSRVPLVPVITGTELSIHDSVMSHS